MVVYMMVFDYSNFCLHFADCNHVADGILSCNAVVSEEMNCLLMNEFYQHHYK